MIFLKTLILLLENKIKSKDFVLPYNSKSLDASTIQNVNQNLSQESLEKIISEILNQNVTSFVQNTNPDLKHLNAVTDLDQNLKNLTTIESGANNLMGIEPTAAFKIHEGFCAQGVENSEQKNMLLLNFLMFSNKQVIEYVKIFSFSTDFQTITSSYNQLINF